MTDLNKSEGIIGFIKKWSPVQSHEGYVYLSGKSISLNKSEIIEMETWKSILIDQGFKVICSNNLFNSKDTKGYLHVDFMRLRIRAISMCETIYTIPDWHKVAEVIADVNICRSAGIEIRTVLNIESK